MWEILRKSYRVAVSYICNISAIPKTSQKLVISKEVPFPIRLPICRNSTPKVNTSAKFSDKFPFYNTYITEIMCKCFHNI